MLSTKKQQQKFIMKNPMKVLAITNLVLLVALIVFILVAKQHTESGEQVGYFLKNAEEGSQTATTTAQV